MELFKSEMRRSPRLSLAYRWAKGMNSCEMMPEMMSWRKEEENSREAERRGRRGGGEAILLSGHPEHYASTRMLRRGMQRVDKVEEHGSAMKGRHARNFNAFRPYGETTFVFTRRILFSLKTVDSARSDRLARIVCDSVYRIVPENLEQLLNKHGPCRCEKFFGKCSTRRFVRTIYD